MTGGSVYHARLGAKVFLKFTGHVRYSFQEQSNVSAALDRFLEKLFEEGGFDDVLIDLCEAASIDSTTLGLMVKLALYMEQHFGRLPTILSTNPGITETLEMSGLGRAFIILTDGESPELELERMPDLEVNEREASKTMLEAHRNLIRLNAKNEAMFRDVIELLERKLEAPEAGA